MSNRNGNQYRNDRDYHLRIQGGDPTLTSIDCNTFAPDEVSILNNESVHALGESLQKARAPIVKSLDICTHYLTPTGNYNSLLEWIETSSSLKDLTLYGRWDPARPELLAAVTDRFLEAAQKSTSIKKLSLIGDSWISAGALIEFLRSTRSVTQLQTSNVFYSDEMGQLDSLTAAVRDNSTLLRLGLVVTNQTARLTSSMLRGLVASTTLPSLLLVSYEHGPINPPTMQLIQDILRQSTNIRHLELTAFEFSEITGLIGSTSRSVEKLKLDMCTNLRNLEFHQAISASSIQDLEWTNNAFGPSADSTLAELTAILQNEPSVNNLTRLNLRQPHREQGRLLENLEPFVRACSLSKQLTHLTLSGEFFFDPVVATLARSRTNWAFLHLDVPLSIPSLISTPPPRRDPAVRRSELLASLTRNTSLLECRVGGSDFNVAADRRKMKRIAERNHGIQAWKRPKPSEGSDTLAKRLEMMRLPRTFLQIMPCENGPTWICQAVAKLNVGEE